VRVGHYARTVSTSAQNASIWSLTDAARSDGVYWALCTVQIGLLTYYLLPLPPPPMTMNVNIKLT